MKSQSMICRNRCLIASHIIERRPDVHGLSSCFAAGVHEVEVARALKAAQ
jgi:hypothetical protein